MEGRRVLRHIYSLLTYLLRPFALAVVLWRGVGNRSYWQGLGERFGLGARLGGAPAAAQCLWVHAVSLGEVSAAAPLVRALRLRHAELPLLLTTATPTGRGRALALFGDSVTVQYLPYDTPGSMRRFLERSRPRLAIIMETELWPNLYHQCRRRGVPIVLANARLSSTSVARYRKFGALFREAFAGDTFVAAQSTEDAQRFMTIGAQPARTSVVGNLKFDIAVDADLKTRGRALRAGCWAARPVWIAGSTHAGEEELVLDAHAALVGTAPQTLPGALLLLVPRHPERFAAVADLLSRRGFVFERRSSGNPVRPDAQVLLVDTVGELTTLYAAVDVAFVGGSLVPVGGHNLLEPAAVGVPVITGPHQSNARQVAELLLREDAIVEVADSGELALELEALFADPARRLELAMRAEQVVAANRGSLGRLLELSESLLAARQDRAVDP
jgi:3-deoxy-D-manno-octulosonic-acid transferase